MSMVIWMAWGVMVAGVGGYGWVWRRAGGRLRRWLEWGLAALVAGVSAASVATHEPWADELHAWLLARGMGVGALWREMACEGHVITWHLALRPLARWWGCPVEAMGWLAWGLNVLAVWWLARRSPLTGLEKAAAGISCVFLYVNPAIARCYVLSPLALWGAAGLWGKRAEQPVAFGSWVALLANTHVAMWGMAAGMAGVYAWENLHRASGKDRRKRRREWAGLGVMAAGGSVALAQVSPCLWRSGVALCRDVELGRNAGWMMQCCVPGAGWAVAAGGLAGLGVLAWRRDRGVFWAVAAGVAWLWGLSLFVYPAAVPNRSVLWWPMMLFGAWALAGRGDGGGVWRVVAVAAAGMALMRPDMTLGDWRKPYAPVRDACREIAERYGEDAEVWINGADYYLEGMLAYLGNVRDWQTGGRAAPMSFGKGRVGTESAFHERRERFFREHAGEERRVVAGSMTSGGGLGFRDMMEAGTEWIWATGESELSMSPGMLVLEVGPGGEKGGGDGARERAKAAWRWLAERDSGQWEAMNNLAWMALEEGRVEEARTWIDRAMENGAARRNAGVRDTEAAVGKAERSAGGK